MKKFLKLTFIFSFFAIFLSGCDLLNDFLEAGKKPESHIEDVDNEHTHSFTQYESSGSAHWMICNECGEIKENSREGHTFTEAVVTEATGDHEGLKKKTCSVCGYVEEIIIPKLHIHSYSKLEFNSTKHYYVCGCGEISGAENHIFSSTIVTEAEMNKQGIKRYTCSVCGYSYQQSYSISQSDIDAKAVSLNLNIADKINDKTIVWSELFSILQDLNDEYNKLNTSAKKLVTNYNLMLQKIEELKQTYNVDPTKVVEKIDAIKKAEESETIILEAREAYDALPSSLKEDVSNYNILVSAEERLSRYNEIKDNLKVSEDNRELLQKAIVNSAFAYYAKGTKFQYDQYTARRNAGVRAEDANEYAWTYVDCSSYCNNVYNYVFSSPETGYTNLYKTTYYYNVSTANITTYCEDHDSNDVVFYADETDIPEEQRTQSKATEIRALMQPGDCYCYRHDGAGHVMLYLGDCFGTGVDYFLHSTGSAGSSSGFDPATRTLEDQTEIEQTEGSIILDKADVVFKKGVSSSRYIFKSTNDHWSIIRPLNRFIKNIKTYDVSLTDNAIERLLNPKLDIEKSVDIGNYHSVVKNSNLVYTLDVNNIDTTKALGYVYVEEKIPEGATFVSATENGHFDSLTNTISWKISQISKNSSKKLSYTLKATGDYGDLILDKDTYVNGLIPNRIGNNIKAYIDTSLVVNLMAEKANTVSGDHFLKTINSLYNQAYGVDMIADNVLVSGSDTLFEFFDKSTKKTTGTACYKELVPNIFYGGVSYRKTVGGNKTKNNSIRNILPEYLEPGDIIMTYYSDTHYYFYAGADKIYTTHLSNSKYTLTLEYSTELKVANFLHTVTYYDFFVVVRPSLYAGFAK